MGAQTEPIPGEITYRERLRTPWWWYPLALGVALILAAEFYTADGSLAEWIPNGILIPLALIIVWAFGRSELSISGGELRVRGAHVPLSYVSGAIELDNLSLRRVVGRDGDPASFVSIRPWIGPGVQILLDDEDDPTPYWVISTRHPRQVIDVLRSAREASDPRH